MVKRIKRAQKGAESLIEEIEKHFLKLDEDIEKRNFERGRYHYTEIDKSLLAALEIKLKILNENFDVLENYRDRLEEIKKKPEED